MVILPISVRVFMYMYIHMQLSVCVSLVLITVMLMQHALTEMEALTVSVLLATVAMEQTVMVNSTNEATIALLPSTAHPQSWAEAHIHVRTGIFLRSVSPYNLPLSSSQLQILSQGLQLTRA